MHQHVKDERLGRTVRRLFEEAGLLMGDADKGSPFPSIQIYFDVDKFLAHMSLHPTELDDESVERIVAMKVANVKTCLMHSKEQATT